MFASVVAAFAVNSISTWETHALLRIALSVLVLAGVIGILIRPYQELDAAGLAPSPTARTTAAILTVVFAVGTLFASTMGSLWLSVVAAQALWLAVTCLTWRPLAGRSEFIVITAFLTMMFAALAFLLYGVALGLIGLLLLLLVGGVLLLDDGGTMIGFAVLAAGGIVILIDAVFVLDSIGYAPEIGTILTAVLVLLLGAAFILAGFEAVAHTGKRLGDMSVMAASLAFLIGTVALTLQDPTLLKADVAVPAPVAFVSIAIVFAFVGAAILRRAKRSA